MTPVAQLSRPLWEPDWIGDNLDGIGAALLEHVQLTAISVGIGLVLYLVLAVVGIRNRRLLGPIYAFVGLLYTIPALALFAFLRPVFGIGDAMAITALTSYTILILVRNIVSALDGVPAEVREAADGMGYRPVRRFLEVEMPLASPVIMAGLRIAFLQVIATVAIGAIVTNTGGVGYFIVRGFAQGASGRGEVLAGAVLMAALTLLADWAFTRVEKRVVPAGVSDEARLAEVTNRAGAAG